MTTVTHETNQHSPLLKSGRMHFLMRLLILVSLAMFAFFLVDLVLHPLTPGDGPTLGNDRGLTFRYFATLAGAFSILVGLLVWRKSPGNLLGGLLILWGASAAGWGIRSEWSTPEMAGIAYQIFYTFFYGLGWQSLIAFLYLYPSGHFYPPKIKNLAVALLFLQAVLGLAANLANPTFQSTSSTGDIPNPVQFSWLQDHQESLSFLNNMASLVVIGVPLVTLIMRFRSANVQERQQIKWLVWLAVVVAGLTTLVLAVWPYSEAVHNLPLPTQIFTFIFLILFYIFPALASLIAIVRYRLWDIDVIIRKTLVYSLLTGLLSGVYFGGVALLQGILTADSVGYNGRLPTAAEQAASGQAMYSSQPSAVVIVVTTLTIAALFNPLRRRLQETIDRRFYRQKYDAEKALAEFAAVSRSETNLPALTSSLVNVVQDTVQPEEVKLWLKST